jgi:hypothetical protein
MSERQRLLTRRASVLFDFEIDGLKFTASTSRFDDGRLAELFLDNHKAGSQIGMLVRDAAIVFSFAVQHGADPEAIRRALCPTAKAARLGRSARRSISS